MPELWAVDNAAWRKSKEFHAHDGSAWRKAKEVWVHDGGAWRKTFSGFTPANPFDLFHEAYYGSATTAGLYFNNDGTVTGTRTYYPGSTYNWGTPVSAGEGANYWVKVVKTAGIRHGGSALDTWIQISSGPYWTASTGSTALVGYLDGYVYIASDAGGTNIVGSGSFHLYAEKIV